MKRSRILAVTISILAFVGATFFAASPASAVNATCVIGAYGDDCIYWGQSYNGSHSGVSEEVLNFPVSGTTEYKYLSAGSGQGQYLGNNNGSNRNYDSVCVLTIWYNPASSGGVFSGPSLTLAKYPLSGYGRAGSGLGTLLNNIRGQSWTCGA